MQGTVAAGANVSPFPETAHGKGRPSRNDPEILPKRVAIHGAEADLDRGRIRAPDGSVTELRAQSARVLAVLVERRGEIVGKDELHAAVWGDIAVTEDSLVQCIGDIRRALGGARDALATVPRRGYCLEPETPAPVATASLGPAAAPAGRSRRLILAALATVAAGLVAAWSWAALHPPPPAKGPVVAVLPFANASGGARWDRLAAGVTDEMIADLGRNDWIAVFAKASTAPLAAATPRQVHAALGADYVVTGTVQAERGRARIAAALVDAETGTSGLGRGLAGSARRPPRAADLRRRGAHRRAGRRLHRRHRPRRPGAGARQDHEPRAFDLYLIATEHKHRFTEADLQLAKQYYLEAVALDPGFAKAWAGLSIAQSFLAGLAHDARTSWRHGSPSSAATSSTRSPPTPTTPPC